jgi:hypothetical protein
MNTNPYEAPQAGDGPTRRRRRVVAYFGITEIVLFIAVVSFISFLLARF